MSKIALVTSAKLKDFASQVVSKGSKNAAAATVSALPPQGTYAAKTVAKATGDSPYAGVKATFIRAVLPKDPAGLDTRDKIDVYADSGIDATAEMAIATSAFKNTVALAVAEAKAAHVKKITVLVKATSKYTVLNATFQSVLEEATNGSGVEVEVLPSFQAFNKIVMFPEQHPVIVSADTPSAELVGDAFAGLFGCTHTEYVGGASAVGGSSYSTVATAAAAALAAAGMSKEAAAVTAAVSKAKAGDNGAAILAAL